MEKPIDYLEKNKLVYDFFKQLTTLNTASILIIINLIGKFETAIKWRFIVTISIVFFLLSLFSGFITMFTTVIDTANAGEDPIIPSNARVALIILSVGFFIFGLLLISIFVLRNFY